jgi:hypothetical protein
MRSRRAPGRRGSKADPASVQQGGTGATVAQGNGRDHAGADTCSTKGSSKRSGAAPVRAWSGVCAQRGASRAVPQGRDRGGPAPRHRRNHGGLDKLDQRQARPTPSSTNAKLDQRYVRSPPPTAPAAGRRNRSHRPNATSRRRRSTWCRHVDVRPRLLTHEPAGTAPPSCSRRTIRPGSRCRPRLSPVACASGPPAYSP